MAEKNERVVLAKRPEGMPALDCFRIEETAMPEPSDGRVLIRTIHISLDPYLRGRMTGPQTYVSGYELDAPMDSDVTGQVLASKDPAFAEGDHVMGFLPWQRYTVAKGKWLRRINPAVAPLSAHIGVLGMPGQTAYVGLLDFGRPKEGESVFVSAAASTVGSLVGQIAKLKGCHVAGSAGSDEKVAFCLDECGYDACFNYKTVERLDKAVKAACPNGVDVYFENVGGPMLDAVLKNINQNARIPLCGMISQYNLVRQEGVHNLIAVLGQRATIKGFIVEDHEDRREAFFNDVSRWIKEGKVKYREHVAEGLENLPQAFIDMLKGSYLGKMVVRLAPESI